MASHAMLNHFVEVPPYPPAKAGQRGSVQNAYCRFDRGNWHGDDFVEGNKEPAPIYQRGCHQLGGGFQGSCSGTGKPGEG